MLTRRTDWAGRLEFVEEAHANWARQWGVNDCAMLACAAVEAVTGVHPATDLHGSYHSAAGAIRAMARWLEGRGVFIPGLRQRPDDLLLRVTEMICRTAGFEPVEPGLAQRGDVVYVNVAPQGAIFPAERILFTRALGFVGLRGFPMTAGEHGLVELPASAVLRAWHIPHGEN